MRRRLLLPLAVASAATIALPAYAVSSGGYSPAKQGCTTNAENSDAPNRVEPHCYTVAVEISDGTHRYVTVGVPQTASHSESDALDPQWYALEICLDFTGTPQCAHIDQNGYTPFTGTPTGPPNPQSGELHAYFGMDDNVDFGEHDSSEYVDNGPSDGGSIVADVTPLSAAQWVSQLMAGNKSFLLTHPLPVGDGGVGFCADGLCVSAQTQRQVAYEGSGKNVAPRDVADYAGHTWDPYNCAGPTDGKGPNACGQHDMAWWDKQNGVTYVEPGIQIYEDPDPQGSPAGLIYPIPAVYVGTCGLVVGGGNVQMPASPYTNSAGQVVVPTGC